MTTRQRPAVLSTRVDLPERAQVRALAELEGVSVCEVIHRVLVPAVRERLAQLTRREAA